MALRVHGCLSAMAYGTYGKRAGLWGFSLLLLVGSPAVDYQVSVGLSILLWHVVHI